jgi:hypothetical protein
LKLLGLDTWNVSANDFDINGKPFCDWQ